MFGEWESVDGGGVDGDKVGGEGVKGLGTVQDMVEVREETEEVESAVQNTTAIVKVKE